MVHKALKFPSAWVQSILERGMIVTGRIFDEKEIVFGDIIDLIDDKTGNHFATGTVTNVKTIPFSEYLKGARDPQTVRDEFRLFYKREVPLETPFKFICIDTITKAS